MQPFVSTAGKHHQRSGVTWGKHQQDNLIIITLYLLLSGDVHQCPGPSTGNALRRRETSRRAASATNVSLAAERRLHLPPAATSGAESVANVCPVAGRPPPPPATLCGVAPLANISLAAERLPPTPAALSGAVPTANVSPATAGLHPSPAAPRRPAPEPTRTTRNPILKKYWAIEIFRTLNHARLVWDHQLKPKELLCGHINIRSLTPKREQIEHLLCDSNIDILGLSETWLSSSSPEAVTLLPGYSVFRQDRNGRGGGVLLYIKNSLKCIRQMAPSDVKIEYVSVKVSLSSEMCFVFICVYHPPSTRSDFYDQLKLFLNHFSSMNEVILVGTHHTCNVLCKHDLLSFSNLVDFKRTCPPTVERIHKTYRLPTLYQGHQSSS